MLRQAIVKIEPGTTEPAQVPKLENPTRKVPKFTNASLPEGCLDEHVWRRVVVPTYLQYAASCDDPWVISDENAIKAMQKIWNTIYERKIKHTVSSISPVFRVVSWLTLRDLI